MIPVLVAFTLGLVLGLGVGEYLGWKARNQK